MKLFSKHISTLFLAFFFLALAVVQVMAQPVDPGELVDQIKSVTDWSQLVSMESVIYTAVITIGGYLTAFIPGLKKIDSGTWRVLVWAIMVIAGALVLGIGNVWMGAISYLFSTSLYEVFLKWILPSPKPAAK